MKQDVGFVYDLLKKSSMNLEYAITTTAISAGIIVVGTTGFIYGLINVSSFLKEREDQNERENY